MRRRDLFRLTAPWSLLLATGSMLLFSPAAGQQQAQKLAEGTGANLVQAKCALCHDLGNITSIRQSREAWEDTIKVMIRRGAPISPEEEIILLDYLTKHYGK